MAHRIFLGDIMAAIHKNIEFKVTEREPEPIDSEERERKIETALDAFSIMAHREINKRCEKEGKPAISGSQVRRFVLCWAKS